MSEGKPHISGGGGVTDFLRAGSGEVRRLYDRFQLQRQLRRNGQDRDAAVTALGAKAWEEKIDLTAFAELRTRLQGVSTRSGQLAATAEQLSTKKAALERERREKLEDCKTRRDAVEAKKRPVDEALTAARDRYSNSRSQSVQARARLSVIAAELASGKPEGAGAVSAGAAHGETAEQKQARLTAEQSALTEKVAVWDAELPGLASKSAELQDEAAHYAAEIAAIDAEQKETLAHLDAEIGRLRTGLQAAGKEQTQAGKEQSDLYRQLGMALFAQGNCPPVLDAQVTRVAAIDAARAGIDSHLVASRNESQALPPGTMQKFWSAVVGVPLLALVLLWGASQLFTSSPPAPVANVAQPARSDPESQKDQTVQRFVQAGTRSDAQTRSTAVDILKDDILTMGATADSVHLPTLAKVLRSNEPELREAAANAMGMIRPTASETKALADLLKDSDELVASAARRALEASRDPAAREILAKAGGGN